MRRTLLALTVMCITARPALPQIVLEDAFPNLTFVSPVDIQNARDGGDRLFIVEKPGVVSVVKNDPSVTTKKTFLDIQAAVDDGGLEEGLLGLAFHPEFPDSPYFYVNYTATTPDRTVISRFTVSANPDSADVGSEFVVLEVAQPAANHNGGQLVFGLDGLLYIGLGDGGGAGDPNENAQDPTELLGKMLRIDVDTRTGMLNYGIPPDNPYVGNMMGWREEIYALGFRNPWRYSFDPISGWLWLGDVGQGAWEEIDIVEKGKNYGWDIMEGLECYEPPTDCDTTGLTMPIFVYDHTLSRRAITGGFVYRGTRNLDLMGRYIYADYNSGTIYALDYDGVNPPAYTQLLDTTKFISTFGQDEQNELYLASFFEGKVFLIRPMVTGIGDTPSLARGTLRQNVPNPFNPETRIEFSIYRGGAVEISVYDVRGRRVRTLLRRGLEPGIHRVDWDGRGETGRPSPSGLYFYSLAVDGRTVDTKRMVLLR